MKWMNRFALLVGTVLASSLVYSESAAAQTTEGTVNIGGTVASTLNIAVTDTGTPSNLDLGGVGIDLAEQTVQVADVTITTNNDGGLSLTITSGDMDISGGGDTPLPFRVLTVADGAGVPTGPDFATASGTDRVENYTQAGGAAPNLGADGSLARDLYIAYDPPQNLDAGTYEATITLTVADL